jgi:hypothetical protein
MRRELAFVAVKKQEIDIRAVIQFAASQFAQRQNSELGLGRTVAPAKFCIPMLEHAPDANFRDLRKLPGRFLKGRDVGKFAKRDAGHLAGFPETKRRKILI